MKVRLCFLVQLLAGRFPLHRLRVRTMVLIPSSRDTIQVSNIHAGFLTALVVLGFHSMAAAVHFWHTVNDETGTLKGAGEFNLRIVLGGRGIGFGLVG